MGSIPDRSSDIGEFALQGIALSHLQNSRQTAGTPIALSDGRERYPFVKVP